MNTTSRKGVIYNDTKMHIAANSEQFLQIMKNNSSVNTEEQITIIKNNFKTTNSNE